MKLEIHNGRLIDPKNNIDQQTSLYISTGKVIAIGKSPEGWQPNRTIDASGLVVCPGLVDLSVRLREPGFEYKATLESEMSAALAGGVTHIVCPPDTDPPLDEPGLVEMLIRRAKTLQQAQVYPLGALTKGLQGKALAEMGELAQAGCVAFSQADARLPNTLIVLRAMQYAASYGYAVWLRPQDAFLAEGGVAHDGEVATRLGLPGIPNYAETIALANVLALARETQVRLHLCRLSSRAGVAMVREAQRAGLNVTCDVAIHHLHLCEVDIGYFNSHCHVVPPLRSVADRAALRNGLQDGTVSALCSDHTPVDDDAKQLPFAEAEPGATGVELLLPLTLKWAQEESIELVRALAKITCEPARVLNIDVGHLTVGHTADICLFEPNAHWKVEHGALKSQGKNTPFLGIELPGRVRYTLVNGQIVYEFAS